MIRVRLQLYSRKWQPYLLALDLALHLNYLSHKSVYDLTGLCSLKA